MPAPGTVAFIEFVLKGRRRIKTWGIFYNRVAKKWKKPLICKKCGAQMVVTEFINSNGMNFPMEYWFLQYRSNVDPP